MDREHRRRLTQVSAPQQELDDLKLSVTKVEPCPDKQDTILIEAGGITYECTSRTGKGSFGVVWKAIERESQRVVAIKRVLQDPKYKNRELQIMKKLHHPNCVQLVNSFYERSKGEVYLNLVLAYVPENLYQVCCKYSKMKKKLPLLKTKLYIYQLCRALAYVHSIGICHRDIKPQNLLIDPETDELKLCDFGSAKILLPNDPNVSYICSRYYRAPELIFGAYMYSSAIDIWSSGCVLAELLIGQPIFAGESAIDQLVEIVKVLGTPTRDQILAMNPDYHEYKPFPLVQAHPWSHVLGDDTPEAAINLVDRMLIYVPHSRITALEVCAHPFFDELRTLHFQPETNLPPLFNFTAEG
eukprot:TRINITY_DN13545_c0_g1_i4.p1 TRINITY_DN13545_c0_g1~~TRINITY_DN13545_c0_g1_i4.p1  ORF type:complete len:356 (-),score=51.29 TRINITY_DN13545_c0_g1_i4:212-1279(-)